MYRSILPILAALLLAPSTVLGDGLVVYHVEVGEAETVPVKAETQRAVLWHRIDTWELTVQPAFPRAGGEAAWIVPFPVVPEVEERDAAFLDQMEALTAPVFVPHCVEPEGGGWFGCGGAPATDVDGVGRSGLGMQEVKVWDAGVTDELEYVILEAAGSDALLTWLDENDFMVSVALQEQLGRLPDQVIFAAKLRDGLNPSSPLSPLSFRLPGLTFEEITYPLRLTALVAPDDGMELALWIVTEDRVLLPKSIRWLPYTGGHAVGKTHWEENIAKIRRAFPPSGGLILEYSGVLRNNPLYTGAEVSPPGPGPGVAVTAGSLGLDSPETWHEGILEIADSGARIARLRGVLTAESMSLDLAFEAAPGEALPEVDNFFWEQVSCDQLEGGEEARVGRAKQRRRNPVPEKEAGAALIPLGLLAGLLALRRPS